MIDNNSIHCLKALGCCVSNRFFIRIEMTKKLSYSLFINPLSWRKKGSSLRYTCSTSLGMTVHLLQTHQE